MNIRVCSLWVKRSFFSGLIYLISVYIFFRLGTFSSVNSFNIFSLPVFCSFQFQQFFSFLDCLHILDYFNDLFQLFDCIFIVFTKHLFLSFLKSQNISITAILSLCLLLQLNCFAQVILKMVVLFFWRAHLTLIEYVCVLVLGFRHLELQYL